MSAVNVRRFLLLLAFTQLGAVTAPSVPVGFVADPQVFRDSQVNLITGEYVESRADLALNCAEPLILERSHRSDDDPYGTRGLWRIQESHIQTHIDNKGNNRRVRIELHEPDGNVIPLAPTGDWGFDRQQKNEWDCIAYPLDSYCNTGRGFLSGRNNLRNLRGHFSFANFSFTVTFGSGERRIYKHFVEDRDYSRARKNKNKEPIEDYWHLTEIHKPNGNRIVYERGRRGTLLAMVALGSDGVELGRISAHHEQGLRAFEADDGQKVIYSFTKMASGENNGHRREAELLTKVELPSGQEENYRYDLLWRSYRPFSLIERRQQEHALTNEYWHWGSNDLGYKFAKLERQQKVDWDSRLGRIRLQRAPVGPLGELVVVGAYSYYLRRFEEQPLRRVTSFDAQRMRTEYYPDENARIWKAERFFADRLLFAEQMSWSSDGNLLVKCVGDGTHWRYKRRFTYDTCGNVTRESLEGRLTGDEMEVRSTYRTYSGDRLNLCLSEKTDNEEWRYAYKPGTDLLISKVLYIDDELISSESYVYDSNAVLIEKNVDGKVERWTTSDRGDILSHENSSGIRIYHRDASRRVIQEDILDTEDVFVASLYTEYDAVGHVIRRTDVLGHELRFGYDSRGNTIYEEHPDHCLYYTYDAANRLLRTRIEDCVTGESREVHHYYDVMSRRVATIDPLGRKLRTEYNSLSQPISEHAPPIRTGIDTWEAPTTRYEIRGLGAEITTIDPCGAKTVTSYTCEDRPYSCLYPDGSKKTLDLSSKPPLQKSIDPAILYAYDTQGRVIEERTSASVHRFIYDAADRIIEECQETLSGEPIMHRSYRYDASGRVVGMALGDDPEEQFFYNGFGELIRHIASDGSETRTEYDYTARFEGHPVLCKRVTDPRGLVTTTYEDGSGHILHLIQTDSFGQILRTVDLFYDLCGRRIRELETVAPSDAVIERSWEYDLCGRIVAEHEGFSSTRYAYDSQGNLTQITKPSGITLAFEYDAQGRRTRLTAPDLSYTYSYDGEHLISAGDTFYEYDNRGNCISETLGNGLQIARVYDSLDRLTQLVLPDRSTIDYAWNGSHLQSVSRNSYTHTYLSYNQQGQPTRESLALDWGILERTYDSTGHPLSISHAKFSESTTLDPLSLTYTDDQGTQTDEYTFSPLGHLIGEPMATYTVDSTAQRLPIPDLTYDADGRLIRKGKTTYSYDSLDRLIRVESPNTTQTYTYDYRGRRLTSTTQDGSVCYLHDGEYEIGVLDDSHQFLVLRVLGHGLSGDAGAAVAIELSGTPYVPLHDRRGCVRMLLSSSFVSESYRYTAFGSCEVTSWWRTSPSSHLSNPYTFCSKPADPDTGLVYFRHRYYDPSLGAFLTPDPFGYTPGTNRYAYCNHDPMTQCDPLGLFAFQIGIGIGGPSNGPGNLPIHGSFSIGSAPSISGWEQGGKSSWQMHSEWLTYKNIMQQANPEKCADLLNWTIAERNSCPHHVERLRISGESLPGAKIMMTHGIWNNTKSAMSNASYIHTAVGGYEVTALHHRSSGVQDVWDAFDAVVNFAVTPAVHEQIAMWKEYFTQNPDGIIIQICHSYGTAIVRNALIALDPELRNRITVLAIAPSAYIWKGLCLDAVHICCTNDRVTLFDRPGRKLAARIAPIKRPNGIVDWSHGVQHAAYSEEIDFWAKEFRKNYIKMAL